MAHDGRQKQAVARRLQAGAARGTERSSAGAGARRRAPPPTHTHYEMFVRGTRRSVFRCFAGCARFTGRYILFINNIKRLSGFGDGPSARA